MHDALAAFRPAAKEASPAAPLQPRRNRGNLLATFACYPELAKAYLTFNGHVLFTSSLPARAREILILRVAVRRRCEYEWAQHVRLGAVAGLTAEEIGWIVEGPACPEWDLSDRSLLKAVDELVDGARIMTGPGRTWRDILDERQLMDLVFTVGAYETLAMASDPLGSSRKSNSPRIFPPRPERGTDMAVQSNEGTT